MSQEALDSVTVRLLWDRLVSIVDEATVTQYRTAFSTVVQEANDFACSVMDHRGGTLANSQFGLPSFVATQAVTLKAVLDRTYDAGGYRKYIYDETPEIPLTKAEAEWEAGRLVGDAGDQVDWEPDQSD